MSSIDTSLAGDLGRAHAALLRDLQDLESAIGLSANASLRYLIARLRATRAHIQEHFSFEEQNGYMDVVWKREPRLERAIDDLAREHAQLRASLDKMIEQASTAAGIDDGLRENIYAWLTHVRQHEERENDLVQDAFELDIGTTD